MSENIKAVFPAIVVGIGVSLWLKEGISLNTDILQGLKDFLNAHLIEINLGAIAISWGGIKALLVGNRHASPSGGVVTEADFSGVNDNVGGPVKGIFPEKFQYKFKNETGNE